MTGTTSIAGLAPWLESYALQRLLAVLSTEGEKARVAGGAVRNALLGQAVSDVDIATTNRPEETIRRAEDAGYKAVPTGAAHGTITVVAQGKPYEVTTLRADIETDGRRAKVVFGRDWRCDAERRDFTINALYAEADGTVVDFVGGLDDLRSRTLRFIGDPETRIREDYLRILRFFRFFAWYGSGRPDAEGLKACARLKEGLGQLSAERIWSELKKLLAAPDPSRALLWMRQAGVLCRVLPESEKWGIDAIHPLVRTERDLGWMPDPLRRLEAIVPPDGVRLAGLAARLKLSKAETERLLAWARTDPIDASTSEAELAAKLYRGAPEGIMDRLRLSLSAARGRAEGGPAPTREPGELIDLSGKIMRNTNRSERGDGSNPAFVEAGGFSSLLSFAENWKRPHFPVKGSDLTGIGLKEGPAVGAALKALETAWVESGFSLDRGALLARAAEFRD